MRIQIFNRKKKTSISIIFGYESPLWSSVDWFSIVKEWYDDDMGVDYATILFSAFRQKRFKHI